MFSQFIEVFKFNILTLENNGNQTRVKNMELLFPKMLAYLKAKANQSELFALFKYSSLPICQKGIFLFALFLIEIIVT